MKKIVYWFACLMLLLIMPASVLAANTPIYVGNLTEDYDTYWQAVGVDYMADEILASLQLDGLNDTQKIRKVYDWVITNCRRDFTDSGKIYLNYGKMESEIAAYANNLRQKYQAGQAAVYNCGPHLVNGQEVWDTTVDNASYISEFGEYMALYREGNCAHFASLFAVMMNHLGYETHVIGGAYINNDGSKVEHKWNYSLINGQYYLFDVRMDNANYARTGRLNHSFFMISDEDAWAKKHEWNKEYTKAIRVAYNNGERAISFAGNGNEYYRGLVRGANNKRITDKSGLAVINIKDSVTYVPLRFVADFFEAGVDWQGQQIVLDYNGTKLTIDMANKTAAKNGTPINLDTPPYVDNGVTYVPLRFVAEGFGAEITYENGAVIIQNNQSQLGIRLKGMSNGNIIITLS